MNLEKKLNLKHKNLKELEEDLERYATSTAPINVIDEAIRLTRLEISLRVASGKALKSFEDGKADSLDISHIDGDFK